MRKLNFKKCDTNDTAYPIQCEKVETCVDASVTRASSMGDLIIEGISHLSHSSFINDESRIWNNAPINIKNCVSSF